MAKNIFGYVFFGGTKVTERQRFYLSRNNNSPSLWRLDEAYTRGTPIEKCRKIKESLSNAPSKVLQLLIEESLQKKERSELEHYFIAEADIKSKLGLGRSPDQEPEKLIKSHISSIRQAIDDDVNETKFTEKVIPHDTSPIKGEVILNCTGLGYCFWGDVETKYDGESDSNEHDVATNVEEPKIEPALPAEIINAQDVIGSDAPLHIEEENRSIKQNIESQPVVPSKWYKARKVRTAMGSLSLLALISVLWILVRKSPEIQTLSVPAPTPSPTVFIPPSPTPTATPSPELSKIVDKSFLPPPSPLTNLDPNAISLTLTLIDRDKPDEKNDRGLELDSDYYCAQDFIRFNAETHLTAGSYYFMRIRAEGNALIAYVYEDWEFPKEVEREITYQYYFQPDRSHSSLISNTLVIKGRYPIEIYFLLGASRRLTSDEIKELGDVIYKLELPPAIESGYQIYWHGNTWEVTWPTTSPYKSQGKRPAIFQNWPEKITKIFSARNIIFIGRMIPIRNEARKRQKNQ